MSRKSHSKHQRKKKTKQPRKEKRSSPSRAFRGNMAKCLTSDELGSTRASWSDVAVATRGIPRRLAAIALARLGQCISLPGGVVPNQKGILPQIQPERLKRQILAAFSRSRQPMVYIYPWQLVAAWRELAVNGCEGTQGQSMDGFWEWLLMISDALMETHEQAFLPNLTGPTSDGALSLTVSASYLASMEGPHLLWSRYFILIGTCARQLALSTNKGLDIDQELSSLLGLQWAHFMALSVAFSFFFLGKVPDSAEDSLIYVRKHFSQAAVPLEMVLTVLKRVATSIDELGPKFETTDGWPDPMPLQSCPLVEIDKEVYVPTLPQFIYERFTVGLYHELWNHWREKTNRPSNQFVTFWGDVVESYVDLLFERTSLEPTTIVYKDQDIKQRDGSLPSDVIVACDDTLVLFEVTHSHMTRKSLVQGEAGQIRKDLEKVLVSKFKQVDRVISEIKSGSLVLDGSFSKFIPVLVVSDFIPQFLPVAVHFAERLSAENMLQGDGISRPLILTLEECEGLLAAVNQGESLIKVLAGYLCYKANHDDQHFTNYRSSCGRPLQPMKHPLLHEAVLEFCAQAKEFLFSKDRGSD